MKKISILCLLICLLLTSCKKRTSDYYIIKPTDFTNPIEIKLAKAVMKNDINEINIICQNNPEVISKTFLESNYSVIHWAAETGKVSSLQALLLNGMNPNAITKNGETPLYRVIGSYAVFPPRDITDVVEILIQGGADCNYKKVLGVDVIGMDSENETPFMKAVSYGYIKIAEIMIEKGNADINATTTTGISAAIQTLWKKDINSAYFIICKYKADITKSFYYNQNQQKDEITPVSLLRKIVLPLDSEEYKLKLEIINEFSNQGINYYDEPIPNEIILQIKKLYPQKWEEYVKVY